MGIDVRDFTTQAAKKVKASAVVGTSPDLTEYIPHHNLGGGQWETVAASQSDQVLGAVGASGDCLNALLIIPATTGPGAVSIKDGSGGAITVFTGGTVSDIKSFRIDLWLISKTGAWSVTTGSNVSVIGMGTFT